MLWIIIAIFAVGVLFTLIRKKEPPISLLLLTVAIVYFAEEAMDPSSTDKARTVATILLIIFVVIAILGVLIWYWSSNHESEYLKKIEKEIAERELKNNKTEEPQIEKSKEEQITSIIQSLSEHQENHPSKLQIALNELDDLVGLENVKEQIHTLTNFITVQRQRKRHHLKTAPISYHCVFAGPPGTGKTTVARILAGIYKELGILHKGQLIETDRAGLVGEYVGQTAVKTNQIVDSAIGGVLFIDEAYNLFNSSSEDYGREAIATLIKRMEDQRNNLVVIMAGYTQEMEQFIDVNPGLKSRFNRFFEFQDYKPEELLTIFKRIIVKGDYFLNTETEAKALKIIEEAYNLRDKTFGNARYIRNLFEKTIERQALRIAKLASPSQKQMMEIIPEDLSIG